MNESREDRRSEKGEKSERMVDARGLACPKPLILTKEALKESTSGQTLSILVDNETACRNVERFLSDQGMPPQVREEKGVFTLYFIKKTEELPTPKPEIGSEKRHIIAIRSDRMGSGSDELGEILLKGFMNTIGAVFPLPAAIVFYNSGVQMARKGSSLIDTLKLLQSKGVKILVCGTCTDYYQIKGEIEVGTISNMYTILETMTSADLVLTP
jgi:selenium metabolism protein YedF